MHPNRNLDNDLDFALQALGNAAPPAGMHQRILRNARLAEADIKKQPRLHLRYIALVAVAGAFAFFVVWMKPHRDASLGASHADTASTGNGNARYHRAENLKPIGPRTPREVLSKTLATRVLLSRNLNSQSAGHAATVAQEHDDATNAPSLVAPQLPITQQEQLLLVAAQGRASQPQVASLRPPVWPLRDPADDEDFRKLLDTPTATNTEGENE